MRVTLAIESKQFIGESPCLTLEPRPNNDHEQQTCERLIERCEIVGFGRGVDGKVQHVSVAVTLKEQP